MAVRFLNCHVAHIQNARTRATGTRCATVRKRSTLRSRMTTNVSNRGFSCSKFLGCCWSVDVGLTFFFLVCLVLRVLCATCCVLSTDAQEWGKVQCDICCAPMPCSHAQRYRRKLSSRAQCLLLFFTPFWKTPNAKKTFQDSGILTSIYIYHR